MADYILQLQQVCHHYATPAADVVVLDHVDFTLAAGQTVALVGVSGAGKSTFLHLAGLLDTPSSGEILIHNQPTTRLGSDALARLRGRYMGFIYQFHHLLPEFTALENVVLPGKLAGQQSARQLEIKGKALLEQVGLADCMARRPGQLSGGQQQRVAIARALAQQPRLLLADEPTGNLDPETAASVFATLQVVCREEGVAMIAATHNMALARQLQQVIRLSGGQLLADDSHDSVAAN